MRRCLQASSISSRSIPAFSVSFWFVFSIHLHVCISINLICSSSFYDSCFRYSSTYIRCGFIVLFSSLDQLALHAFFLLFASAATSRFVCTFFLLRPRFSPLLICLLVCRERLLSSSAGSVTHTCRSIHVHEYMTIHVSFVPVKHTLLRTSCWMD
jgi:hypothetical protein